MLELKAYCINNLPHFINMKTIIASCRDFSDYNLLESECDKHAITEVVSGRASGADELGEFYANDRAIPIKYFPAQWGQYGTSAGPIRNGQMADYAEALIAFWDGKSKGTANMIKQATGKGLNVTVVRY